MDGAVSHIMSKTVKRSMSPFILLQISDCHLGSVPNDVLLGLDTDQSFHDVMRTALANEKPDMILVSGDISNDGGANSYTRFLALINYYFPQTPLAWLPGNHDDPQHMPTVAQHPIGLAHSVAGWHFIFLDSRIPMQEGGRLGESELARLEHELETHADKPTLVFLHHQPVPVGSAWLDQYVVEDADNMFSIIDRFPQVKAISWGHVHQEYVGRRNNVALLSVPSTCVQFLPRSDNFQIDTRMPGYRVWELSPAGLWSSHVQRAQEKFYSLDMSATGY